MIDLRNKVAIVTGGNRGLGKAYCEGLSKCGANIVVVSQTNNKDVEDFVINNGCKYLFIKADLTKSNEITDVIKQTLKHFNTIDILVNNAGSIIREPVFEHRNESWDYIINLNLTSVFKLTQIVVNIMKLQKSGKVINIGSMLSFTGGMNVVSYTASKHGIIGLTKSFANECAKYNIQVNAIAPGYIKTDNTKQLYMDEHRRLEIENRIACKRWGNIDDIVGSVLFLSSNLSDYITGIILPVDGGFLST